MNDLSHRDRTVPRHRGMRIGDLELIRYGRFADRQIGLRSDGLDLHVLVGANEAGKTTARAAISDLLYGFSSRTIYDFRYPGRELRVAATLESGAERLAIRRRKGNSKTLADASETILPDTALLGFIGTTDRSFFERMFSLDHPGLVRGGHELLEAKDDLGRLLFQSAAGMAGLGAALDALEEQRNALWSRRRSGSLAYYKSETRLKEAQDQLKAATLRAGTWQAATRDRDQAIAARDAVVREQAENGSRSKRLQRQRAILPKLGLLARARAEADQLAASPLLPPDSAARLQAIESEIAIADARLADLGERAEKLRCEMADISVDRALIARAADVRGLDERRAHVAPMPADIAKQQARIAGLQRDAVRLAAQLGWSATDEAALAAQLPTLLVRSALRELAQRRGGIAGRLQEMDKAIAFAVESIEENRREIDSLPTAPPDASIARAIEQATALGDTQRLRAGQERKLRQARSDLQAALQALLPWQGTIESLRALSAPRAGELEALRQGMHGEAAGLAALERTLREQKRALEQARLREAQIRRDGHPVSAGEVAAARQARDSTWQTIRNSLEGGAIEEARQRTDGFETEIRSADGLADRRHDSAAASAQLTEIRQQIELQEQTIRHASDERERAATAVAALRARLEAICVGLSLPVLEVGVVEEWLRHRTEVLKRADAVSALEEEARELDRDCGAAGEALAAAMPDDSLPPSLPERLQLARSRQQAHQTAWDRREALSRQLGKTQRELAADQKRRADAQRELAQWQEDWQRHLATASLAKDSPVAQVSAAIDLMQQIEQRLADIREITENRIGSMLRDLAAFADEAKELAAAIAPDLATLDPASAIRALRERCDAAERSASRVTDLEASIAGLEAEAQRAADSKRDGLARLAPLMHEAAVETLDALRQAIDRSDRRREALRQIETLEREVLEDGDGLSLEALTQEAAGTDRDSIAPMLAELERQKEELEDRREQARAAITSAESQLAAMQGQDAALRAEEARQDALSSMGDAAERWATLTVGTRLLRAALDLYRERQQDPLLKQAGTIFATLTLQEYAGLRIDHDDERPTLVGVRRGGDTVPIEGLSTGTRDQLFLALRIAAVGQYLDSAPGLPFVADDLFINFDDSRAAAGFTVLQELAARTQVLFFTHHAHLAELARTTTSGAANIVTL